MCSKPEIAFKTSTGTVSVETRGYDLKGLKGDALNPSLVASAAFYRRAGLSQKDR
jgi:hypothetical protein